MFDNDRLLLQELEDQYDNLPDAVANLLNLSFWDGSYSPFVTVFAPFPIEIVHLEVRGMLISMKLSCSPLVNLAGIKLKLQRKDDRNRQIGGAQTITGFRRLTETEISLKTNLHGNNLTKFLTLKLYYDDDLIQVIFPLFHTDCHRCREGPNLVMVLSDFALVCIFPLPD